MIGIPMEDANRQANILSEIMKSGSVKPLSGDIYLEKAMTFQRDLKSITYPHIAKIPKNFNSLMRGDYSPAREIVINEPLSYKKEGIEIPMWFGETIKEISLAGIGFEDGDSRRPCNLEFNDGTIHGAMNGATGQGKSVLLEAMLDGIFFKYPPWETRLVLVDAKIATFQKFGYAPIIPHISSIAATEDVDFLISVLEWEVKRMQTLNAILPRAGFGDKLEDFRKGTGLCIPRTLIIVEELTAMTMNAGKKLKRLLELLHLFTVLGRSTGVHLYLSTQAFDGNVKEIMDQIQIRSALGCSAKVSKNILGNTEAKNNLGKKGRFIINLKPQDESPKDNKNYRVPYSSSSDIRPRMERIVELSEKFGYSKDLSFYNEHDVETIDEFVEELEKHKRTPERLFLGEPGYMTESVDGFKRVALDYDGFDRDSILVVAGDNKGLSRAYGMLAGNYRAFTDIQHYITTSDKSVLVDIENLDLGIPTEIKNVSATTDPGFQRLYSSFFTRKMAIDTDEYINDGEMVNMYLLKQYKNEWDRVVEMVTPHGVDANTARNQQRFCVMMEKFNSKEFEMMFKRGMEHLGIMCANIFFMHKNAGSLDRQMVREDLVIHVNWVIGIDRITGLGRSPQHALMESLRVLLLDGYKYNLRFVMFGRNIEETASLATAVRYGWMEGPVANKTISGFKIQDYFPSDVPTYSIAFYDANQTDELLKVVKFKKPRFSDEI